MFLKRSGVVGILLLCTTFAFAQNARRNSLGGTYIIDDMVDVLINPADMNYYTDAIQASFTNGPIVGVKALGDVLSAGMTYSNLALSSDVYSYFLTTVLNSVTLVNIDPAADVDPIPHVLFGIDLDAVNLGFDIYFERAFYSYMQETVTAAGPTTTTINADGRFTNMGLLAGFNLDPDIFGLSVTLGLSMPRINGEYTTETTGVGTDKETAETETGIDVDGAVEITIPIGDVDLTAGLIGGVTSYQGKYSTTPSGGTTTTTTYDKNQLLGGDLYAGIQADAGYDILAAVQGSMGILLDKAEPDQVTALIPETTDRYLTFALNGGLEKEWNNLTRLDAIYARSGLGYGAVIVYDDDSGEDGGDSNKLEQRFPTTRTGFTASVGMGIKKGVFQFDIQANPFDLVEPLAATITVDFGGESYGGGSSSGDFSTSTPSSYESTTPATDYDSAPSTTEDTSTESGESSGSGESFDF